MTDTLSPRRCSRRGLLRTGGAAAAGLAVRGNGPVAAQSATPTAESARAVSADAVASAIAKLEPIVSGALAQTGVPGLAVAIVHDDKVVYTNGFGVRSVDAPDKVDAETVFQLASVSKSLSATIVAGVVGDGHATWDDHLIDHLGDFQLADPWVTRETSIRDCFCHRTGMPGTAGDDLEGIGFDRDEIIHRMRSLNLTGKFRQTYAYSNFGVTLGSVAAASAAGKPWEDLATERLYAPLGMTATSSRYADFAARTNRALLHTSVDGKWLQKFTRDADAQAPAGGVSSNVVDLAQWLRLLLGGGTVDSVTHIAADALAETHVPQIVRGANPTTGAPGYYGLGWNLDYDDQGRIFWDHAGAFSVGARTVVNLLPEANLGIVVLTNAFPTGVPEGVAASFYDLALSGSLTRDWVGFWNGVYDGLVQSFATAAAAYATPPVSPAPALAPVAYAGRYTNAYFGDLTVDAGAGGALAISVGARPAVLALRHWERDLFIYEPAPELPGEMAAATFAIDVNGEASAVTLESLDSYGQGAFTRAPASA